MSRTIEQRVFDNLNTALENEYDMTNTSSDVVADDVLSYADYDFEDEFKTMDHDELVDQVRLAVEKWQNMKKQEK